MTLGQRAVAVIGLVLMVVIPVTARVLPVDAHGTILGPAPIKDWFEIRDVDTGAVLRCHSFSETFAGNTVCYQVRP